MIITFLSVISERAYGIQTISTLPYSESFELGSGLWQNVTGDDMDWTRRSGYTPSRGTGPAGAQDGTWYYYTEASWHTNKTTYFEGPIFNLTNYTSANFSFYYSMNGADMGTLSLQVSTNNGATWSTVWTKSGNQGTTWHQANVSLNTYSGQIIKIRFKGVTGSSYKSDMAIDNITVTGVEGPSITQLNNILTYSESFESSSNITWINDGTDDIDWTRHSGSTSTGATGPSNAREGNYYYYINSASPNNPNKTAYLRGPDITFDATVVTAELTFWYHMYGTAMGTLTLQASTDQGSNWTSIWSLNGDQNNYWHKVTLSLNDYVESGLSLRFKGVTGTGETSDMAVDDIGISTEISQEVARPDAFENYIQVIAPQSEAGPTGASIQNIQYFDGLGRTVQTVQYEASPDGEDIITSLGYDQYGRQHKSYLPFEKAGNNGQYYEDFANASNYTASYGTQDDEYAYSEIVFEASPLNRAERQRAPGQDWKSGENREVKMGYGTNGASEVRHITVSDVETSTAPGYYAANQLIKNTTWDENQTNPTTSVSRVEEFTDKLGRVVCKKVFDGTEESATHYVYDDYNNLRYVIQPNADVSDPISSTELEELCFQYTYDKRQRMIIKKVPGAAPVYMVYDTRDRLVLTQDGVQRTKSPKEWTYTKYDYLNRPVMTGIYESNSSHTSLQSTVMGQTGTALYEVFGTSYTDGYTNTAFPTTGIQKVLTVTYYDKYGFKDLTEFGGYFEFDNTNGINIGPYKTDPKGAVTGGKARMLNDTTWLRSAVYYDDKLQAIQTISDTYEGKWAKTYTKYNFAGNVTDTRTVYKMEDDSEEQTVEKYEYDHVNRLISNRHSVHGQDEIILAKNEYDEIGRLTDKKLHSTDGGTTYAQSIDYRYNIRGWLTGINNADRTVETGVNDDANDLFGMELSYNASPAGLTFVTQYNGNISGMRWSNGSDGTKKSYGFEYDGLNRIKKALFKERSATSWNVSTGYFDVDSINYDKNGNIETLRRKEANVFIDKLAYAYHDLGNKLKNVDDGTNNSSGFSNVTGGGTEYWYDANGNMRKDINKHIDSIRYNLLNLAEEIIFENGNRIKYYYDAAGTKWRKVVNDTSTTDYFGSAEKVCGASDTKPQGEVVY